MRKSCGSKWELDWVRSHNRGQIDQGEVLDDCYYVNSALDAFALKIMLLPNGKSQEI